MRWSNPFFDTDTTSLPNTRSWLATMFFGSLTDNENDLLQMICKKVDDSLQTDYDSSYPQYPKRRRETGREDEVEQSPPSQPTELSDGIMEQ